MIISSKGMRVYLKSIDEQEAESIVENINDEEIYNSIASIPKPYTINHAREFIEFAGQRSKAKLDYHMGIFLPQTGFIGMCALANIDSKSRNAELGYWIGKNHRGNRYSKEAMRIIMKFGFEVLGLNKIYAEVLPENKISIHLLESVGFQKEGIRREHTFHNERFMDKVIFGILKRDYADNISIEIEEG